MKWKRGPSEYLSEKTFLVVKDDLVALRGKFAKEKHKGPTKASDTGTWPPKMKRIAPLYDDTDRPKTANLEKPNILNPKLIDKLDMSLLSKELLCESMTRFQLSKRPSGGTLSIPSSSKRRQSTATSEQSRQASATSVSVWSNRGSSARPKRKSFEQLTISDSKFSQHDLPTESPMQKQARITSQETLPARKQPLDNKKLDDNNNRNGTSGVSKVPALSSVRKRSSRATVSADFQVFTGSTVRTAPEPCKACGRPDQPERFHSHPKGTFVKEKDSANNGKLRSPVPKSIQKPVPLHFRSDKSKNKPEELEAKPKCFIPRQYAKEQSRQSRPSSAPIKRGPKTVTCYICGREFGTASFPIHELKCMEKWERENNALPLNQRRPTPQKPDVSIDHSDWNAAAWQACQAQLVPCSKCGRTFAPDRLQVHQRSCKVVPKEPEQEKTGNSIITKASTSPVKQGPPAIPCKVCGRNFGTRSIKIHEPQCVRRWQIENKIRSATQSKKQAVFGQKAERKSPINLQELSTPLGPSGDAPKPTVTCYICGRDFGSTSIAIHEPQCLRKWHTENDKLPENQRRDEPQKPEIIYTHDQTTGAVVIDLTAMAEASWKSHLSQLIPCKKCGRTFNPDRVGVHERSCKGSR